MSRKLITIFCAFVLLSLSASAADLGDLAPRPSYQQRSESGIDSTSSKKKSQSKSASVSLVATVNLNNLLLREYSSYVSGSSTFVSDGSEFYQTCLRRQGKNLNSINIGNLLLPQSVINGEFLARPRDFFPIFDWSINELYPLNGNLIEAGEYEKFINEYTNKFKFFRFRVDIIARPGGGLGNQGQLAAAGASQQALIKFRHDIRLVRQYLMKVAIAHLVLSDIASALKNQKFSSVEEIRQEARTRICNSDFEQIINSAIEIVNRAYCTSPSVFPEGSLLSPTGWTAPFIAQCGSVIIDAESNRYMVDGRITLTDEYINGQSNILTISATRDSKDSVESSKSSYKKNSNSRSTERLSQ